MKLSLLRTAVAFLALGGPSVYAQQSTPPFVFDPLDPWEDIGDNAPKPPFVSSARRLLTAPELEDASDKWIGNSFDWVNFVLANFRPAINEHPIRKAALIRLDDILHIESAPRKEIVQKFYRDRLERAIEEIERTKVTDGMRIWKLYNHGFLVRTASVSFTFDIVPGIRTPGFSLPPDLLERLVKQSDATFISHLHNDHANQDVARLFLSMNKPVIVPEGLWADVPDLASRLTYPKRSTETVHEIAIARGQKLRVVAYPGHQGPRVLVNVHLVKSPEGFTVVQTGDQSGAQGPGGDFDWMAHIGRDHRVDVLMPNCWANGLGRMVRGINPRLVITGHENEMAHTVPHREDYTQTYHRLHAIRFPAVVMTWGESFSYQRRSEP